MSKLNEFEKIQQTGNENLDLLVHQIVSAIASLDSQNPISKEDYKILLGKLNAAISSANLSADQNKQISGLYDYAQRATMPKKGSDQSTGKPGSKHT